MRTYMREYMRMWRAENREHYNTYQREQRKKKKEGLNAEN